MAQTLSPPPFQKFFDHNGLPAAGYQLFTYAAGTSTKLASYVSASGGTNANPIQLNAFGECNLWIPPNVAYKYVLAPPTDTDPPANPLWTIDNIVNSQLLTLYGGVDTGSANVYALNFTANFTAYTDGIIIYWIPSHTNTGASTININGLGAVAIKNGDGSLLTAGEIIQNQPATLLYISTGFILLTESIPIYGNFPASWNGFSVAPTGTTIAYRKTGNVISLIMPITTGTSNSTGFSFSGLPAFLIPGSFGTQLVPCFGMIDNGVQIASAGTASLSGSASVFFYKDPSGTGWTASGNKGFGANAVIQYSL